MTHPPARTTSQSAAVRSDTPPASHPQQTSSSTRTDLPRSAGSLVLHAQSPGQTEASPVLQSLLSPSTLPAHQARHDDAIPSLRLPSTAPAPQHQGVRKQKSATPSTPNASSSVTYPLSLQNQPRSQTCVTPHCAEEKAAPHAQTNMPPRNNVTKHTSLLLAAAASSSPQSPQPPYPSPHGPHSFPEHGSPP